MTTEQLYQVYLQHPSIQTDTRKLKKGDLFFALKGPNFNGNLFAAQALEQGAAYAIVDEAPAKADDRILPVNDALETLQALALHHRRQFDIPFIAITGSNGKTTTKELIHAVLSSQYQVYTTQGNLNNHIGVPLTILSVKKDARMAVIEMGANHLQEIAGYCTYTLPTHGLITNVGKAHLEGFGGPEGVKKGKGELYDFLRSGEGPPVAGSLSSASGGTAFVCWDYDYLREMSRGIRHIITYGTKDAEFTGELLQSKPFLSVAITGGADTGHLQTQLVGDYNLPNVLAAVAVGRHFGVADAQIRAAIGGYSPSNSRSQLIRWKGNEVILDAYNANPSSMRAAIENFAGMPAPAPPGGKILILGAMAELGQESLGEHRRIIDLIGQVPWQQVVLVGGDFQKIQHPYHSFENAAQAANWLRNAGIGNSLLLIKGSRSMRMEEVLQ